MKSKRRKPKHFGVMLATGSIKPVYREFILHNGQKLDVNDVYAAMFPNNCPVSERTADGFPVGTCTFFLKDGVCPRHGHISSKKMREKY